MERLSSAGWLPAQWASNLLQPTVSMQTVGIEDVSKITESQKWDLTYQRVVVVIYALIVTGLAALSYSQSWWSVDSILTVDPSNSTNYSSVNGFTLTSKITFGIYGEHKNTQFWFNITEQIYYLLDTNSQPGPATYNTTNRADLPVDMKQTFDELFLVTICQMGAATFLAILVMMTASQFLQKLRILLISLVLKLLPIVLCASGIWCALKMQNIANYANDMICQGIGVRFSSGVDALEAACSSQGIWTGLNFDQTLEDGVYIIFRLRSHPGTGWWMQVVIVMVCLALSLMTAFGTEDLMGYKNRYTPAALEERRSRVVQKKVEEFLEQERREHNLRRRRSSNAVEG